MKSCYLCEHDVAVPAAFSRLEFRKRLSIQHLLRHPLGVLHALTQLKRMSGCNQSDVGNQSPWRKAPLSASRPRVYLWIRRPVHRPPHALARRLNATLREVPTRQMVVLFSSLITIALGLAIFVH